MTRQMQLQLVVPDRFEGLKQRAPDQLNSIIEPVEEGLDHIDEVFEDMTSAGRGAFIVLRGNSGTGKTTFLHTMGIFREGVATHSIPVTTDVGAALQSIKATNHALNVIVLEEREALKDIRTEEIERDLHAINGFLRSGKGANCMVVWPCNTENLQKRIVDCAKQIGSDALLGIDEEAFRFSGPRRDQFLKIAENTVATLNQGASLADLGLSKNEVGSLIDASDTVGKFLGAVRRIILEKNKKIKTLIKKEHCKLWIVVVAGNDPDGEVAALTRGGYSSIDIDRLMSATNANIVEELKAFPQKLGILGTVLDAKVFHLPIPTALDIARQYADDELRKRMKDVGFSDKPTKTTKPLERLRNTDLGRNFQSETQSTRIKTGKLGSNTLEAFGKLMSIAQDADTSLNRAIGEAFLEAGYIHSYETEKDLGSGLRRRTDLFCGSDGNIIRLEIMWRTRTSRAEIANYVLQKLHNYGRAIEFLST